MCAVIKQQFFRDLSAPVYRVYTSFGDSLEPHYLSFFEVISVTPENALRRVSDFALIGDTIQFF